MIMRNEIPILEYDSDPAAVIMPDHEHLPVTLPKKAVFAFLGSEVDRYAADNNARIAVEFESETKNYPVYVLTEGDCEFCLVQAPVGAAPAAQVLDWLIAYGVREIISVGCCGALMDFAENEFLVPRKALRDEGASYHYLPPSRFVEVNSLARNAIEKALTAHGIKYQEVVTWSTDGFFRETREKVEYRKSEGCGVVEMECAALAACAQLRSALWGELLFTADTLANAGSYDERNWGRASQEIALRLAIDAVMAA